MVHHPDLPQWTTYGWLGRWLTRFTGHLHNISTNFCQRSLKGASQALLQFSVDFLVSPKAILVKVTFPALGAFVRLLFSMDNLMFDEPWWAVKALLADWAYVGLPLERSLSLQNERCFLSLMVLLPMPLKRRFPHEILPTVVAFIHRAFLSSMDNLMAFQVWSLLEVHSADWAHVQFSLDRKCFWQKGRYFLSLIVPLHMLIKSWVLDETLPTNVAFIGSLSSMDKLMAS